MIIIPTKEPTIWFRDKDNPAFANLPNAPFIDFLNAFCPPAIQIMFDSTDRETKSVLVPYDMKNTKLMIQPIDKISKNASPLPMERKITITSKGTIIYHDISTYLDTLIEMYLDNPISLTKGDVICVVINGEPGLNKQVLISLVGIWG